MDTKSSSLSHPSVTAPSLIHPLGISANAQHPSTIPLLSILKGSGPRDTFLCFLNISSPTPAPTQAASYLVTNASEASCGNKPTPSLERDWVLDLHCHLPASAERTLSTAIMVFIASKKIHLLISKCSSRLLFSKDMT